MTTRWADMDDCLHCELCGRTEWVKEYCEQCVEDNLAFIRMMKPGAVGPLTDGSKQRIFESILDEHRKMVK